MLKRTMVAGMLVAGLAAVPPALGQGKKGQYYEPSQRLRTALETCMKDEVMNGANCVKKCQEHFTLDLTSRPPVCVSTRPEARYVPPRPTFVPPDRPLAPGAKGT